MADMRRISSLASRALFGVAAVLGLLALWEKVVNLFGYQLSFLLGYTASRLLEVAVVALLFVIALQLRELRFRGTGG